MALTVETGGGVTGADSYVAVADVLTFATDYGVDPTGFKALSTAAKEGATRMAAVVLDSRWRRFYPGLKRTKTQGLMWPRIEAYDVEGWSIPYNEVPAEIQRGQSYLALLQGAGTDIYADADQTMQVEEVRGASGAGVKFASPITQVQFRAVHLLLERILIKGAKWTKAPAGGSLDNLSPAQIANL